MPLAALLATAALCLGFALLPCRIHHRRPVRRDLLPAGAVFAGIWAWAFLFFGKPGLFVDFGLFRLAALCAAAAWVSACVCGFRLVKAGLHGRGHRLPAAALLVFTALGLEIFFGNVNYFVTHDYTPIQLFDYLDGEVTRGENGEVLLSEDSTTLHFSGMDQPICNLQLEGLVYTGSGEYTDRQDPLFTLSVAASDEANANEISGGSWDVAWRQSRSWSRMLDYTGAIGSLTLTAAPYDGEYIWYSLDYTLTGIAANAPQPFRFSLLRFGVMALVLLAGWALRPSGTLWNSRYFDAPRRFRPCAAGLILFFSLLACLAPFANPVDSGVATSFYNVNNWDGVSNIYFTKHINDWQKDASSQLGSLAHSLLNGRLDLELDPPEALVAMENPYDTAARAAQAPDALWDVAYHDGRYYVYFGVVPCLLFQLPFEALTGTQDLPPCVGMIVMSVAAVFAAFGLVKQAARRWFPRISAAAYLIAASAVAGCGQLYYLLLRPSVYEYVILCGASFVMLALWQWMAAANTPEEHRGARLVHLVLGSLFMALVAGCRPQMEIFAFLALPIFWKQYVTGRRLFTGKGAVEFVLFALPFMIVAAGLMAYNYARFGSPFDFGANYNLTSNDMTKRGLSLGRVAPALHYYLFAVPLVKAIFPYVSEIRVSTNYMGQTISELLYGGIVTTTPFLWVFALLPALRRRLSRLRLWGVAGWCLFSAVALSALDAMMAGILYRYLMDFALPLTFAAALCWLALEQVLEDHSAEPAACRLQRGFRTAMPLAAAAGMVYSFCVFFAAEPWLRSQSPALYQTVSRLIQFWL